MDDKMKSEFWRWPESNWKNPAIDWEKARFINVGIDVGSVSSQAVVTADGQVFAYGNMQTGSESADSAQNAYRFALEAVGDMPVDRMDYCIGTGYGRVNVPFADRTITEIACHARGANFIYGASVRTVLDVGGQDIKAIRCDHKGKVTNFLINDKCAAGTGRGMEVFSDLLGVPITEIGDRAIESQGAKPTSEFSTCVVYAKSEAIRLRQNGWETEAVLGAYCKATAERIYSILERINVKPGFAVTGGMAKNRGVMDRLTPMLGHERMRTGWDTQIAGAIGAALFAYKASQKGKRRKQLFK